MKEANCAYQYIALLYSRIHLYSLRYIRHVVLCKVRVLTAEESVFQLLKTLHQLEEMSDGCRPCSPSEVWHISEEKERHQDSCWSYQIFILLNSLLTPEHNMHILHTINLVNISNGTNYFLHSHFLNVWFREYTVRKILMLVQSFIKG